MILQPYAIYLKFLEGNFNMENESTAIAEKQQISRLCLMKICKIVCGRYWMPLGLPKL